MTTPENPSDALELCVALECAAQTLETLASDAQLTSEGSLDEIARTLEIIHAALSGARASQ
jgi:hypothetical protein